MAGAFSLEAIFTGIDRISVPVGKMQGAVQRFTSSASKGLKTVDEHVGKIGGVLAKTGAIVAAGTVAAGAGMFKVISAGADFEEAITAVGAVSLMSRGEIADLEKKAIELGGSTKFSAVEVANAMELMGKAGFDNAQIMSGVGGVLAAAAADGMELADAAGNISNVLKGMGLDVAESGKVADVLTLASARTNSSIASLSESMAKLGPVAKQFKIPLEDAVGMAALLQDAGLNAESAGTSAASMLTKLAKPTKQAAAMMKKMGVNFQDSNGNMISAVDIFGQMQKAVKGSKGNIEQAAFFAEIMGLESQKAGILLTEAFSSGKADKLIDELNNAKGAAEKMAALRMNNLKGDVETLGGSVDSLFIKLSNTQSGPLRGVVQGFTKWIDLNADLMIARATTFIAEAVPIVLQFGSGVRDGAESVGKLTTSVLSVLGPIDELFGGSANARITNARALGEWLVKGTFAFYAFSGAVKVARVGVFLFDAGLKIAKATAWLFNGAIRTVRSAMLLHEIATKAGTKATIAMSLSSQLATADLIKQKAAAFGAAGGFKMLAKGAGVAAVATAAYMLVADQNDKLKAQTGGMGILDIGHAMASSVLKGEGFKSGFDVVNEHQNAQARVAATERDQAASLASKDRTLGGGADPLDEEFARLTASLDGLATVLPAAVPELAAGAPLMVSPQERIAHTIEEKRTTTTAELTIRDETGRGELTKKPKGGGHGIRMPATGGL